VLYTDWDDLSANGKAGDWAFINDDTYIIIRLGADMFKDSVVIPVIFNGKRHEKLSSDAACWQWNGNKESPTLTPSILVWGNGQKQPSTWHGYLTAGKLIEC
jgi:hypothetical protein